MKCVLCKRPSKSDLCKKHDSRYIFEKKLDGYRLKKRTNGTRYIPGKYHKTETNLIRIIEKKYGKSNVVMSYRPLWAVSDKGVLLEYDIYVPSKNLLIEYNGRQHYEYVRFFHKSKKRFKAQQDRDALKSCLAQEHGLELLIFRYDEPILKDYVFSRLRLEGN